MIFWLKINDVGVLKNGNKYDDGEANYKLPLFNYMNCKTGSSFWTRNIYAYFPYVGYCPFNITSEGAINKGSTVGTELGVRPLIYLR